MKIKDLLLGLIICLSGQGVVGQNTELGLVRNALQQKGERLTPSDLNELVVTDFYLTKRTGITHLYASQSIHGIAVVNSNLTAAIGPAGEVRGLQYNLFPNIASKVFTANPGIDLATAVNTTLGKVAPQVTASASQPSGNKFVLEMVGPNNYRHGTTGELVYFITPESEVKLAWSFDIDLPSGKHWWHFLVDAVNGEELRRLDWQTSCNVNHLHNALCTDQAPESSNLSEEFTTEDGSGYNVFAFPVESPIHGSRSLVSEPGFALASPFGWHDTNGFPGAEHTITRGNNVYAYDDINDQNQPGFSPDGGSDLTFSYPLSLNLLPQSYTSAAITNLFYANNRIHDLLYQYGFDESAGNFQANNYGNGGLGQDWVLAEAQDGGGSNNANMATPPDGDQPRMQMYLWSSSTSETSFLHINAPEAIEGNYQTSNIAAFGPPLPIEGITADVVQGFGPNNSPNACGSVVNSAALDGKIALIDRGGCNFTEKVLNAQAAGAVAVMIANNVAGGVTEMGGSADGITIPSLMISQAHGNLIKNQLNSGVTVNASLGFFGDGGNIKDGSFDNGIIIHEYIHGLTNRLTGGPSQAGCLGNEEQMGEGWSDWYCVMLTMDLSVSNPVYRPIGTFAVAQSPSGQGIRPAAYDTSFSVNPYTYANLNNGNISVPHGVGFIWGTMLWDLTWALVNEYGFDPDLDSGTSGNNLALQLVTDGLKLQVCEPGFVDGRNAILLADEIANGGANACLIWEVFAKRGLGYNADQGSSQSRSDGTASFELPPICQNVVAAPNADFDISAQTTCDGFVTFTDLSTNTPQSWIWEFGDGETSSDQNPIHMYSQPGTYTVSLTVTNLLGDDVALSAEPVVFQLLETPEVEEEVSGCDGEEVFLTGTSATGTLAWYNAMDSLIGSGNSVPVLLSESNNFFYAKSVNDDFETVNVGPDDGSIGIGNYHNTEFTGTVDFEASERLVLVSALVNTDTPGPRTINLWDGPSANGNIIQQITVDIDFTGEGRINLGFEIDGPGSYSIGLNQAGLYRNNGGVNYPYSDPSGIMTITGSSAGPELYYYFYDIEVDLPVCQSEAVEVLAIITGNTNFEFEANGLSVSFTASSTANEDGFTWDFGDGDGSDENAPTHIYAIAGEYTVTLNTPDGCSRTKTVVVSTLVGIRDNGDSDAFQMMPNPTDGMLSILSGKNRTDSPALLRIFNMAGQEVKQMSMATGEDRWHVNVNTLANGVYMISLHDMKGESIYRQRIVVAH